MARGEGDTALRELTLCAACQSGDTSFVQILLGLRVSPDATDEDGSPAIFLAAEEGRADVVSALIGGCAGVDAIDGDGFTALMVAVEQGHEEIVDILLQSGADPAKTDTNESPLSLALAHRDKEKGKVMVTMLVGEKVNYAQEVALLIEDGAPNSLRMLKNAGAQVSEEQIAQAEEERAARAAATAAAERDALPPPAAPPPVIPPAQEQVVQIRQLLEVDTPLPPARQPAPRTHCM